MNNGLAERAYQMLWVRGLGRVLSLLLLAPIRVYQHVISPLTPASCRYHPSCSAYTAIALQAHGPLKGLALGAWRVVRCNPWSAGGVDPVPSRGRWTPDVLPDGSLRQPAPPGPPAPTSLPGV